MFGWLFGKRPSPKEVDDQLNRTGVLLDACFYIAADDGKDTVVNRHLQKRADHLEEHYKRMAKRVNKASTRHGRA
jgi:hypothetical protein